MNLKELNKELDKDEDDEPDYGRCRHCLNEWEDFFLEPNGLCPLCY